MTNYFLSLLPRTPGTDRSIDRLRAVYTDLLWHIDLDNSSLGDRRGIDDKDVECHKKSTRFSFRRNLTPSKDKTRKSSRNPIPDDNRNGSSEKNQEETRDAPNSQHLLGNPTSNSFSVKNESFNSNNNSHVDLATAFRILAATKSPDKEGDNYGAVAIREDSSVCGIQRAKALERRVCELIQQIGEIVVAAGGKDGESRNFVGHGPGGRRSNREGTLSVRTDPVFEYFCEKCILSLFVDIAREVRQGKTNSDSFGSSEPAKALSSVSVHGVVWSGVVKAQVYETVSLLVSDVRNQSIVYYLLSNNYINELIKCIMPLQQWTEPAISKMLPAYVDLLKNLTLQLADDPHLFPFLTIENTSGVDDDDDEGDSSQSIEFPLFSAALETATSVYAQSNSQIYATCLAIIVNLMHVPHLPIQTWICQSSVSQRILADHLCQRLLDRYHRMTNLTRGPVVDGPRHNAIVNQLVNLKDEMGMVHEIFWSGVRGMDVRLCESLLQRLVSVLLKSLSQSPPARPFLTVGLIDLDVIPEQEASAQVATLFFSYMFSNLVYIPFQRMLAVALFHPNSTPIWSTAASIPTSKTKTIDFEPSDAYVFMPALSDIVNEEKSRKTCPNPFRHEMLKTLEGDYGEWRTAAVACLLQSVLDTDETDTDTMIMSGVITGDNSTSSLEHSIAKFFVRSHKPSAITVRALECMGRLGLLILHRNAMNLIRDGKNTKEQIKNSLSNSPIWIALTNTRDDFCKQALAFRDVTGVSDIFLDLTEAVIKNRYTGRYDENGTATFTCHLSRRGSFQNMMDADFLVRRSRCVSANDVETTRFYINMGIHFRILCNVMDRLCLDIEVDDESSSVSKEANEDLHLDFTDTADPLTRTIGGLSDKLKVGSDLDLTGRMFFKFQSAVNPDLTQSFADIILNDGSPEDSINATHPTAQLMLVLDPTEILIVKPLVKKMEENRGTVLCGISLRNIIAAAVDGTWLHIAIRNPENIKSPTLIKNGNMAMQFDSSGTCLIVKQYFDRSREVLRQDLLSKVPDLLHSGPNKTSEDECRC
ncbi:unnamed protein product [Pseudo-nitzschia multistriata]|uniref:FPL domain-containing protein n=1 Tax=Pseudo-nitzschia multistriata TaxID=183589 RepID=A0A448ZD31_9STRA|nr:unnamed protein product [Pseudo-nitzschia multistriata]